MIRGVSRRLRTLSLRQYMVVLVTVLIPMLVSSILDLSMGWVWLMLAGWCLASVLIMAEVFREERADVNQRIAEKVDEVLALSPRPWHSRTASSICTPGWNT